MGSQVFNGLQGKKYSLGNEIGSGGEGIVSEILEDATLVIKLYRDDLEQNKVDKLIYMSSIGNSELQKFAAWPIDIVKDNSSKTCGFVMRKLEGYVPIHKLFSPMDRKMLFPDKGYNFLIHVARNLAIAFHKIHQFDVVVGDVNEVNILVNKEAMIAFLDCDSFQVKNRNIYHFCEVGVPRYTPPEILVKNSFENVLRSINTDSFSLATLIFQLLFLGRAPFTGINSTTEEIEEEKAIITNEFAYSIKNKHKKLIPAKYGFAIENLTTELIELFHNAFEKNLDRPLPIHWAQGIANFNKEVIMCVHSELHIYPKKMPSCPWCDFKKKVGITYFFDDANLKELSELNDIDQFVNGFKIEKIEIQPIPNSYTNKDLRASPIPKKYVHLKHIHKGVIAAIIITTIGLCFISLAFFIGGGIIIAIFDSILQMDSKLRKELANRKKTYDDLKFAFDNITKHYNNPIILQSYNQSASKLNRQISDFKNLPNEYTLKSKRIEQRHYEVKYHAFLQRFDILYYTIPTFGPAKKLLLQKNGIRTAADISRLSSTRIAGIGPANIHVLERWQQRIGLNFTYIPDDIAIKKDIGILAVEIGRTKKKLEGELKVQYLNLQKMKSDVLTSAAMAEKQYLDINPKLQQAELDYKAFQAFIK